MATKKDSAAKAEDTKSAERVDAENREAVVDEQAAAEPVKNPLWQSGNVSTNDPGPRTEDVSHVFAEARAQALGAAVDAVESGDPHPENVVLPEDDGTKTNDEAIADLKDAHQAAEADLKDNPDGLIVETSDDSPEADASSDADKADEAKKAAGDHK
jgi:hypothetical protein